MPLPKRHRLDVFAENAASVTLYQRARNGDLFLIKTCQCRFHRPIEGNWRCNPCRGRTWARLHGRDESHPAKVEIKIFFRDPADHTAPLIERYFETIVPGGPSTRNYRLELEPAPEETGDPYVVTALAVNPDKSSFTQRGVPKVLTTRGRGPAQHPTFKVPQELLPTQGLPQVDFTAGVVAVDPNMLPGLDLPGTPIATDPLDEMPPGSSVEVTPPAEEPIENPMEEGLLWAAGGAAIGLLALPRVTGDRLDPLQGGLFGAVAGWLAERYR